MNSRTLAAILVAALVVISGSAGVALAASTTHSPDFDSTPVQNPEVTTDVTKDYHEVGWAAQDYEGDDGTMKTLDATINQSEDYDDLGSGIVNEYSFTVTDINESDFSAFPHDKDDVSALDAGEWSGTGTASDVETAPGVDAAELDFAGNDHLTFSNFSVTSDENKRYLQIGLDATTVNSGTVLEFRVVDEDGDYYAAELNASGSSGDEFIGSATGDGYVFQHQLGEMSLVTAGGGTFDNIEKLNVTETGGAATTVEVSMLNVEKMSQYKLGEEYVVDSADDETLTTETIYEVETAGDISVHDLNTLGTTFDDAEIHDLTIPMEFQASSLDRDDDDMNLTVEEATDYPSFDFLADTHYRLTLPDAYDLSYANANLVDHVNQPSARYETVEYAEGVSDSDWDDITYTDTTSLYDSQGDDVTIDSTIQPGQEIAVHYEQLWTEEDQAAAFSGGTAPSQAAAEPGLIGGFLGSIWGKLSAFGAALFGGIKMFGGS